jgi:hypothetical protein
MGQRIIRVGLSGINGAPYVTSNGSQAYHVTGIRGARKIGYGLRFPGTIAVASCGLLAQPTNNVTRASGSFIADGVRVGMYATGTGVGTGNFVTAMDPAGLALTLSAAPTAGTQTVTFNVAPSASTPNFTLGESQATLGNESSGMNDFLQAGWSTAQTPTVDKWLTGSIFTPYGAGFFGQDVVRFRPAWTGYASPEAYVDIHQDSDESGTDPVAFVTLPQ